MKILFPTPVIYDGNDARFLARDGARFAQYLSSHGHGGIKVILSDTYSPSRPKSPLLATGTFLQWCDPTYWRSFQADGALCYFGLDTRRFTPVVKAMREAGIRVALKLDSAFGIAPRCPFSPMGFARTYWFYRQRYAPLPASFWAFLKTVKNDVLRRPTSLISYLALFDSITAESPLSANNTEKWCISNGREDIATKITSLPNPVPDDFSFVKESPRTEDIVLAAASDWDNPLKGGRIAIDALRRFLGVRPTWHALVVGGNSDALSRYRDCPIRFHPKVYPSKMKEFYHQAKIFLIASGAEGNPNVVFEAAACGCSVVFPPNLEQLSWVVDSGMGTMASSRTPVSIAEALEQEAALWNANPFRAKQALLPPLTVSAATERLLLALFDEHNT